MGVLIPIIGVCIPLVAVAGSFLLKWQKMKMDQLEKSFPTNDLVQKLNQRLEQLASENEELKTRILNVETIVTDEGFHIALPPKSEEQNLQKRINELIKEKERLKA